jgi:hypothetical protein
LKKRTKKSFVLKGLFGGWRIGQLAKVFAAFFKKKRFLASA